MWALWNVLKIQLGKNTTTLAKNILKCLNERDHVIKNPTVFAALFLDPRYKNVLIPAEQQVAKCELFALHNKLQKKVSNGCPQEREIDELEMLLMTADINANDVEATDSEDGADHNANTPIHVEFDRFKRLKRIDKEVPVLSFWKSNKEIFPNLYVLAKVLFGVPNGQTSVERGFSSLDFIYDRRRCNLDPDVLNDILIVRLNESVFDTLDDSEWDEILGTQTPNEANPQI